MFAVIFCARPVMGQGIVINFDENGNGSVQFAGAVSVLPSLGNIVDPFDPGSGIKPLAYNLSAALGVTPVTPGDVDVVEPPVAIGQHSDLLRWTFSTANQALLLVYSDLPESGELNPPLADVGIPLARQPNNIILPETGPETGPNGLFGYVPAPGNPGFIPAPPGPATYNFLSDPQIPEPASFAIFGLAAGVILLRRRRRR
jgi:hypothetical protein